MMRGIKTSKNRCASCSLSEIEKAKSTIERNNIMIGIYINVPGVEDKVNQMRIENLQMELFLQRCNALNK